eukprot:SAG22_NODE_4990_length_1114_cov_0.958621_1_plen_179_part_00
MADLPSPVLYNHKLHTGRLQRLLLAGGDGGGGGGGGLGDTSGSSSVGMDDSALNFGLDSSDSSAGGGDGDGGESDDSGSDDSSDDDDFASDRPMTRGRARWSHRVHQSEEVDLEELYERHVAEQQGATLLSLLGGSMTTAKPAAPPPTDRLERLWAGHVDRLWRVSGQIKRRYGGQSA